MQFTGTSSVLLPQVNQFSFSLTGVKVSDTGVINFTFYDTGANSFSFGYSGGFISTNKPISSYNTVDRSKISGYYQSGVLSYYINGVLGQQSISFTRLNKLTVQTNTSTVNCDLSILANQINYSVNFNSGYQCFNTLTGTIVSDTTLPINSPTLFFFNSFQNLLSGNYPTGLTVNSGNTVISLNDIDPSFYEYQNNFNISLPTTFGDIGGQFSSYRSGIINQSVNIFLPSNENVYSEMSLFDGTWSGNKFTYVDNPLTYNLGFNYSSFTFNGIANNSVLNMSFQPLHPLNGSGYQSQYITGFTLTTGGQYSVAPTAQFSQYYYVTGLQNSIQSFLFSSGCSTIPVTFSGGSPTIPASGVLVLKQVRLSGIYNTGIANFMIVSGYSGISSGLGYQSPPTFVLGTGVGCFSVPDASGVQTAQFKFARGSGAVYAQAAGLTGLVLVGTNGSGLSVTGIEVTNIGFGYSTGYPPNINFLRDINDTFQNYLYDATGGILRDVTGNIIYLANSIANDASGNFSYKATGLYEFDQFWDIFYNIGTGFVPLNDYMGYYSGSVGLYGNGNVGFQINCVNLDNTSAVSGLLTTSFVAGGNTIIQQNVIYQTRTFDLNTGALLPFASPTISVIQLPDLSYILNTDALDDAFQDAYDGGTVNNIITF